MTASPLGLSGPLYGWSEAGAAEGAVSFDDVHQRVIHRKEGGFSTIDIGREGGDGDGNFVKFEAEGLRCVRFSPDGLHFAFLCQRRAVGCAESLQPSREPIMMALRWARNDADVLDLLWLQGDQTDVAVVTTQGIETFRLSFEQRTARSLKAVPSTVRLCWTDSASGMVLACTGPRTLQPFNLQSKSPKMPRFDLVLGRDQVIEPLDVAIMTIYDAVYCIHADSSNGRVSLRNVSNPAQGTPEHDVVIDVSEEEALAGTLRLSKVDNLLIVHCIEKRLSMIFDIRHKERSAVPRICGPCKMEWGSESGEGWEGWTYFCGSVIFDSGSKQVFRLGVNMSSVLQHFLIHPHELATVIQFLLRRGHCREHIVHTLVRALQAKAAFDDCSRGFAVLNHAYRQAIEAQQSVSSQGRQATVSLQEIESVISQQSILSERDMVSQVFHPHFLSTAGLEKPPEPAAGTEASAACEAWRLPLPPKEAASTAEEKGGRPARSPYLLSVVLSYLRSLLSVQILPHKSLQCFVFDLCMYYLQEQTLQQLLHYHVLLDSPALALRLRDVAMAHNSAWATQACFDVALRIHEFSVVAEMLLHTKQYLDIVPFLMNQREISFRLSTLLDRVHKDESAQAEDPDLLDHVMSEIRAWRQESEVDPEHVLPLDLTGCQKWMPELPAAAAPGPQAAAA